MTDAGWEPPDAERTWELSTWTERRPVPLMEREFLVRVAAAQQRCHDEAGFSFGLTDARFVNGFCYMARIDEPDDATHARRARFAEHARAVTAAGSDLWNGEVRPIVEARLASLRRSRRGVRTLAAHADRLEAAIDAAADAMGNLHWRMWDPSPFDWPAAYQELTGGTAAEAAALLAGVGHQTARLVARLRKIARLVQASDEVATDRSFARLLRDYGRRTGYGAGSPVTFATPTWSMRPAMVRDLVAAYAASDLDATEAAEQRARRNRGVLTRRVRKKLRSDGDRLAAFEAAYAHAIGRVRMSEDSNHLIEQETVGTMREAIDDAGAWLVDRGMIDDRDDAFGLSLGDLRATSDLRGLVKTRKEELERWAKFTPPPTLGRPRSRPQPARAAPGAAPPASADEDGGEIRGAAVSPGRAEGRARVVPMTVEPPDLEPGDVLVAADAGPAWTPVLPLVRALVLDRGAVGDHAAIMARDLGVPAVMQTGRATKSIPDGATVIVDGTAGVVRVR